nr:hypothetical protein [Tanacetum cinerariifolium]GEY39412.1 hypothetical protein [Tanacetum cinerariifolium]
MKEPVLNQGFLIKGDDDKIGSNDDGKSDADDNKRNSFTLKDYDEEEHDEEYKSDDDNKNVFEEEDDDLKFLILENVPPVVDEVASMMNVKNRQKESSTQAPSLFTVLETAIPDTYTPHATTVPPTISMISLPP